MGCFPNAEKKSFVDDELFWFMSWCWWVDVGVNWLDGRGDVVVHDASAFLWKSTWKENLFNADNSFRIFCDSLPHSDDEVDDFSMQVGDRITESKNDRLSIPKLTSVTLFFSGIELIVDDNLVNFLL